MLAFPFHSFCPLVGNRQTSLSWTHREKCIVLESLRTSRISESGEADRLGEALGSEIHFQIRNIRQNMQI